MIPEMPPDSVSLSLVFTVVFDKVFARLVIKLNQPALHTEYSEGRYDCVQQGEDRWTNKQKVALY